MPSIRILTFKWRAPLPRALRRRAADMRMRNQTPYCIGRKIPKQAHFTSKKFILKNKLLVF